MPVVKTFILLAGVLYSAYAQGTSFSSTTRRPGLFSSFLSGPLNGFRGAANAGLDIKGNSVTFGANAAHQLTSGVIGAKQSVANMANGLASSGVNFGAQAATNMAGIGASLLAPVPILGQFAGMGSKLVGAGASAVNAAAQTGIATLQAAQNAKLNAINGAVQMGAGMAQTVGSALVEGQRTAVNTGMDMASSAVGTLDAVAQLGSGMMNSGASMVNRVTPVGTNIAAGFQANLLRSIPTTESDAPESNYLGVCFKFGPGPKVVGYTCGKDEKSGEIFTWSPIASQ